MEITPEIIKIYAGTGGMEELGRTVDRLHSDAELSSAKDNCTDLGLTGLVLVGNTRTCTITSGSSPREFDRLQAGQPP